MTYPPDATPLVSALVLGALLGAGVLCCGVLDLTEPSPCKYPHHPGDETRREGDGGHGDDDAGDSDAVQGHGGTSRPGTTQNPGQR